LSRSISVQFPFNSAMSQQGATMIPFHINITSITISITHKFCYTSTREIHPLTIDCYTPGWTCSALLQPGPTCHVRATIPLTPKFPMLPNSVATQVPSAKTRVVPDCHHLPDILQSPQPTCQIDAEPPCPLWGSSHFAAPAPPPPPKTSNSPTRQCTRVKLSDYLLDTRQQHGCTAGLYVQLALWITANLGMDLSDRMGILNLELDIRKGGVE